MEGKDPASQVYMLPSTAENVRNLRQIFPSGQIALHVLSLSKDVDGAVDKKRVESRAHGSTTSLHFDHKLLFKRTCS